MIEARIFGLETRADGTQYVSFRVTKGTVPSGPWHGQTFRLIPLDAESADELASPEAP